MRKLYALVAFVVALVASGEPGHAQVVPGDFVAGLGSSGTAGGDARVSTITTGRSSAARKLAQGYPAAQQAATERLFEQLLQSHPKIESMVGIPAGDAAGAVAAFVIASFEAYRDVQVDPKHYMPVVDQVRRVLQSNASFARASASTKRELYEHSAMLAIFVSLKRGEAKKSGDPAALGALRDVGRQYLSTGAQARSRPPADR